MTLKIQCFFLLGALAGCSGPQPAARSGPAPAYKIAYNVAYDTEADDYEIFVMDMDGKNVKNISNWKGVDWVYYAWEDKLYFLSDRDTTHRMYFLYEMKADGSNVRKICPLRLQDSWFGTRNQGSEIIVNPQFPDRRERFYIANTSDGNIVDSLSFPLAYLNDPCFSPDGRRIVFRGSEKKFKKDEGYQDELYIANADGSDLRKLTTYPAGDTTVQWYKYHAGPAFWEPHQDIISFLSYQKGNHSIFLIKPDGTGLRQLSPDDRNEGWHTWSPDGKYIVYDGSDLQDSNFDIFLMDADGTNIRQLTTGAITEQSPVFVKY